MSIASEITRIQGAKNTLKTKINAKNDNEHQITNETIDEYGDFVDSISTGTSTSDATASQSDILATKTAYIASGKVTGSMANNGALSYTPGDSAISIPAGYTSGGTISAVDITTLSDYQACEEIADEILQGVDPYIFLDYIQSTGSQYINTGYTPDHDTRIVMELSNNVSTGYAALWAADRVWGGNSDFVNFQIQSSSPSSTNKFIIWYPSTYYMYTETDGYSKHTYSFYRGTFIRDGVTVTTNNNKNNSVTSFNTLWIWKGHNQDVAYTSKYRLHSLKIYYNPDGTLIHNYIPAKRTADNELGLYDTVTESFYTNAGTGVFLAGEPLEEE